MIIWLPLLFALVGLFLYFTVANSKWQEIGRILFGCGILAFLFHVGNQTFSFLK